MDIRHGKRAGALLLGLAVSAALLPAALLPSSASAAASLVLAETHEDGTDLEWDAATEVTIALANGASTGGDGVRIEGDVVTITAAGTYRIEGSLSDGQLLVDTEDEDLVRLILDGVSIISSTTAPLSISQADEVAIVLADGTENRLADAEVYQYASEDVDEPNAALFSTADLTIGGTGSLTVDGRFNDGIASKDGLVIADGTIVVSAADDGIRGKDYLVIKGGSLTVDAGGDALKADNDEDAALGWIRIGGGDIALTSGSDAIEGTTAVIVDDGTLSITAGDDAIHSEARLEVHGGRIEITSSVEGLEGTEIVITGGDIELVSSDDGLNVAGGDADAAGTAADGPRGRPRGDGQDGLPGESAVEGWFVEISGGTLVMDADGDGLDSNGSGTITGGTIVIDGPTQDMNGAIDVNGELLVSGGTLVASGSAGMAEAPDDASGQATLAIRFGGDVASGTVVRIQASDGTAVLTYAASKPFTALVVSTPELVAGDVYEVLLGGSASGEQVGGLFIDPEYTVGTMVGTVTAA